MLKTRASREFCLLALLALLVLGAGLGLRDPHPADEPRFALVAKQMVDSGNWLFPHRGTELYSDKPPMLMWLQASFYTVFGNWRVAFLLPSLLAGLGTLACVYDLGRRLWTRRVGMYAAYALLFAFHFTYQAKKAQIDPLVVFYITLANYGLLRHLLRGPDWRMWALGWFAAGLGTITKGVGALALLILLPAAAASLAQWRGARIGARDPRFWLGPLAFLGAVSIWLVPMVSTALSAQQPEYRAYLDDILFRQTAGRYARSWDHPHGPLYFFGVMPSMWLPLLLALPWAIPAWVRRLRRRDPRYLLPLAWWALIVLFFSIPTGKRDVYILPALPMLCLAMAPLIPGLLRKTGVKRLLLAFTVVVTVALGAVGAAILAGHGFRVQMMEQRGVDLPTVQALAWILLALGLWGVASLALFARRRPELAMVSTLSMLWVLVGLLVYPLINTSSSARGVMEAAGRRIGPAAELGLVAWKEQNLLMADRAATTFGFVVPWDEQLRRGVAWQAQAPQRRWLLVQEAAMLGCIDRRASTLAGVSNRRNWWLVPAAAVHGQCTVTPLDRDHLREQDKDRFE
ncbi:ArnT family glycosyltransferase [Xanthomonas translucens]|uniref:ArnT family glycosyltransferase n=2 Tax=Xanthomonas campestris pv. translucens TaxID=343 RepID=UPI00071E7570|nr:glycosyltransferase family 39 protein [Xanthomonas translucens]KTF37864.1 dolichyl-phosphate-mannose-protein mannosyltransferase [Xanthomonas translucens pv. translucens]KWV12612.1 dolichyl-phosphate-mannose-protein mannosyltransferase [Xanthomonas translucens]MCS3361356.1 glycosyltransferase family 39 protein [Xanthomonas translucens pv. translucens]MCS3375073.1 glycosyltransferase family 39 protein [Xanthomonas translucens pv. translucens]MCT8275978.1 glycosyltransferase family 39 protein